MATKHAADHLLDAENAFAEAMSVGSKAKECKEAGWKAYEAAVVAARAEGREPLAHVLEGEAVFENSLARLCCTVNKARRLILSEVTE